MSTNFYGLRGSGDFVTDARPKNWRNTITKLYINGDAPFTALIGAMKGEMTDDPEFNWWTQTYKNQGGAITGVYKSSDLSTGTGLSAIAIGNIFYVKCAEVTASFFREGHQALMINSSDLSENTNCLVTGVVKNGASSFVVVKALQASTGDPDSAFDRILIVGNINAEGGVMPDVISIDEEKWYNYTQIFRTPLSITRTAMNTKFRTGDKYQKMKAEALETHSIEMEKAFLFGYPSEGVGANGKPMRTTMGLVTAIRGIDHGTFGGYPDVYTEYSGQTGHFPTDYSGQTWLDKGEEWIDTKLATLFQRGAKTKLAFCGNGVLLGINKLIKSNGNFDFTPATTAYGLSVKKWITSFGDVDFVTHPLFNYESSLNNSCVIFEPKNLVYRYITDTTFYGEGEKQNTGAGRIDGISEEYLTECGLEFHDIAGCAFYSGFNTNG